MTEVIDVEIIRNYLPAGDFIVLVNQDSFDDQIFEHYFGDEVDQSVWIEVLTTYSNPDKPVVIQGCVNFYNTHTGTFVSTNETVCKIAEDVQIVFQNDLIDGGSQLCIRQY